MKGYKMNITITQSTKHTHNELCINQPHDWTADEIDLGENYTSEVYCSKCGLLPEQVGEDSDILADGIMEDIYSTKIEVALDEYRERFTA